MTKNQLAALRKRLGMNKAQLARVLDVDRATVGRWESGELVIPRVVEMAVKSLDGVSDA